MPSNAASVSPTSSNCTLIDTGTRWDDASTEAEMCLIKTIDEADNELAALRSVLMEKEIGLAKSREELNALRAPRAPINRVPDDVLALIFEANADDIPLADVFKPKENETPTVSTSLSLLQVCRRWRAVASHTPALWSSIIISDRGTLEYASRLVEQHAFQFGLLLQLKCSAAPICLTCGSVSMLLDTLIRFITEHAHRLVSITSSMCSHDNDNIFGDPALNLPELRKLNLERPKTCRYDNIFGPIWPESKFGAVKDIKLGFGLLPAHAITVHSSVQDLSLIGAYTVDGQNISRFLSAFPFLRSLRLLACHSIASLVPTLPFVEDGTPETPVVLEHLAHLTLWDSDFPLIIANNLRHLALGGPFTVSASRSLTWFSSLVSLSVNGVDMFDAIVKRLDPLTLLNPLGDPQQGILLPCLILLSLQDLAPQDPLTLWAGDVLTERGRRLRSMLVNRQEAGHGIGVLRTLEFPSSVEAYLRTTNLKPENIGALAFCSGAWERLSEATKDDADTVTKDDT